MENINLMKNNPLTLKSKGEGNFLEISLINEILENIEQIDNKCKTSTGEDLVNLRIKQLTYSKILCNVYSKDLNILIKAYTQLGAAYLNMNYFEQATEHILIAFKLIQSIGSDDMCTADKEFQIKILIYLSRCYMESPDKLSASLSICEKCLELNKKLFGNKHISNADIYLLISKINRKLKNYEVAVDNLTTLHQIYEETFGYDSDKSAQVCSDLAEIYEDKGDINSAIENYKNSYTIWEKIVKNTEVEQFDIFINLAIKLAELYNKAGNYHDACEILKYTEVKYSDYFNDKKKLKIKFKQLIVNNSFANKDILMYLQELLEVEIIMTEYHGDFHKNIAKNCVSIAFAYLDLNKKKESYEYFEKAENIFNICGNSKAAKEVNIKKQEIFTNN